MSKKIIAFALLALLMLPVVVFAQQKPAIDLGLQPVEQNIALGTSDIRVTIARIINVALGLLGVVCVIIVIAGGVMWMMSGGEAAKTGKARGIIFAGVIGLAIILSAYAIASFVIGSLQTAVTQ
jgi:hypothetical protein